MIEWLFFPVQFVINILATMVMDYGIAIIMLSILLYIGLSPVRNWGRQRQHQINIIQQKIQPKIDDIKRRYKGEEQHKQLEKLYTEESYSPFTPLKGLVGLGTQIPILILIYYSLLNDIRLDNQYFLSLFPLAQQDASLSLSSTLSLNILPILMWLFGTISALLLTPSDEINISTVRRQQRQGIFINTLFLFLLYAQPAAIVLYWASNNFLDMVVQLKNRFKNT